jgi:hypothetical protein
MLKHLVKQLSLSELLKKGRQDKTCPFQLSQAFANLTHESISSTVGFSASEIFPSLT